MYYKYLTGLLLLTLLASIEVNAQRRPSVRKILNHDHFSGMFNPGNPQSDFLRTQYWLGFKSGAGVTKAHVQNSFSSYNNVNADTEDPEKEYKNYKGITSHAGLELTYYHKGFYFSLLPEFRRHSFTFDYSLIWESSSDENRNITEEISQTQRLDYVTLPFLIKYDLTHGTVKPFLQAGAFFGKLVGANYEIKKETVDNASGAAGAVRTSEIALHNKDSYLKSLAGYILGIGLNADVAKVRIVFDLQYRTSFHNITNVKNRYSDDRLASFGDVPDDIKLTNISANIGILFPLRYVGSGDYVNKK